MAPNYDHVRTNWVTCDLPCVGPPVVKEGTRGDEGPCALRETRAECVFLTASQISSGTLSVPAKRAEAIFSLACAESDAAARVVVAMEHIDEDEEGGGVDAGEEEDGTPNVLIPIREPFSPSRVEGQSALPPPCLTPLTHTIRDDNKVVVWDSSASKGYLVKLRKFASQPTQVFLNGLHPLFDGLEVTARCAVCFFPTGVLGHAQAVVAHAGAVDGMYARIAAGVVHEWGPSGKGMRATASGESAVSTKWVVAMIFVIAWGTCAWSRCNVSCVCGLWRMMAEGARCKGTVGAVSPLARARLPW